MWNGLNQGHFSAKELNALNMSQHHAARFVGPSLLVALLASTADVRADCEGAEKRLFFCNTVNDKVIELCDAGATIHYRFGRPNATPELALRVPRHLATTWQWQGIGRWMRYSVEVPNGDTHYDVFFSVDRLSDEHPVEAGVEVTINRQQVARVACRDDGAFFQQLEGVDLPPRDEQMP